MALPTHLSQLIVRIKHKRIIRQVYWRMILLCFTSYTRIHADWRRLYWKHKFIYKATKSGRATSRTHGLLNPILCDGWYARKHRKKSTQTSRFPQALFPCFWYDLGGFNPHSFRLSDGPNIQWISVPRLSSLKYGFVAFSVETTALQIYASAKNGGYP